MKKTKKVKKEVLKNLLSKEDCMKKLNAETFDRITVSFYKYVEITDTQKMRDDLWRAWNNLGCLGRIYIAREGINAQMSVPEHNWEQFKSELYSLPEFKNVPFKKGVLQDSKSFWKLTIIVKKNIVADGLDFGEYNIENVGNHLTAAEFNTAMSDPETIIVDMRNQYESEIGHFDGALCHDVDTFRDQLPMVAEDIADKKDQKLLLYCTGGIRCEKASAYFKDKGFTDVNQLHGGVIAYKHQVENEGLENKFLGSNYVFDGRDKERIGDEIISNCHQCGDKSDRHVNCANKSCNLLFLQCEPCEEKMLQSCSKKCKKIASWSAEKQKKYYRKHSTGTQKQFS
ncbi:MAG: rhodanese-related sulfurtransferase, partial [Minisyncoccia bacterium]